MRPDRFVYACASFFFGMAILSCAATRVFAADAAAKPSSVPSKAPTSSRDTYLAYFEEVYQLMKDNYYFDVRRSDLERFIKIFDEKIYPSILLEGKSGDYVRWRSAAYLVDALKQPDDIFTRFLPPKPAQQFVKEVYGKKVDLGIEGHAVDKGYLVDFIEPRSDAYAKGLREQDLIVRLDGVNVVGLEEVKVKDKLNPLEGARVKVDYISAMTHAACFIEAVSREYFKQTVFIKPTGVPDIYCLQVQKFNQGTPEDFSRLVGSFVAQRPRGLILDLRGNPGGPPLAARAIAAFFLPNGEPLVYFEGRTRPRADLDIPVLPPGYHIDWPMVVLVDKSTGSAAELFSGVLQDRKRALVFGEATAGQVLLKSLYDLSDGSTMAMVNARGHFPDGRPFPFDGVHPNELFTPEQKDQAVSLAAKYLLLRSEGRL